MFGLFKRKSKSEITDNEFVKISLELPYWITRKEFQKITDKAFGNDGLDCTFNGKRIVNCFLDDRSLSEYMESTEYRDCCFLRRDDIYVNYKRAEKAIRVLEKAGFNIILLEEEAEIEILDDLVERLTHEYMKLNHVNYRRCPDCNFNHWVSTWEPGKACKGMGCDHVKPMLDIPTDPYKISDLVKEKLAMLEAERLVKSTDARGDKAA
jgi:hypothetical protein